MSGNDRSAPDKSTRQICYDARDAFFKCVDGNQGNAQGCEKLETTFLSSCSAAWIKHFKEKRVYEQKKAELEKIGYKQMK